LKDVAVCWAIMPLADSLFDYFLQAGQQQLELFSIFHHAPETNPLFSSIVQAKLSCFLLNSFLLVQVKFSCILIFTSPMKETLGDFLRGV